MRIGLALSLGLLVGLVVAFVTALLLRRPGSGELASKSASRRSTVHEGDSAGIRAIVKSSDFRSDFLLSLIFFVLSSLFTFLMTLLAR